MTTTTETQKPRHFLYRASLRDDPAPLGRPELSFGEWWENYRAGGGYGEVWVPTQDPVLRAARRGDVLWFVFDGRVAGGAVITRVMFDPFQGRHEIWWDSDAAVFFEGKKLRGTRTVIPAAQGDRWHRFAPLPPLPEEVAPTEAPPPQELGPRTHVEPASDAAGNFVRVAFSRTPGSVHVWGPTRNERVAISAIREAAQQTPDSPGPHLVIFEATFQGEPRTVLGRVIPFPHGQAIQFLAVFLREGDELTAFGKTQRAQGPSDALRGTPPTTTPEGAQPPPLRN